MSFTDERFLLFLPFSILSYFMLPLELRPLCLLFLSLIFYLSWGVPGFVFVIFSNYIIYAGAIVISKAVDKNRKRFYFLTVTTMLLGVLVITKTGKLIMETLSAGDSSFVAPIGISYMTLSLLSYIMDVYRGRQKAERNPVKFLLYTLYFPKVLQGPITRYGKLSEQLFCGHRFDYERVCFGLQLMLYGYFKKLVIADRIAVFTGTLFSNYETYRGSVLLVGLLVRPLQLYYDFSGYMDIAIGLSQVFGIDLPANFNRPFFSKSAAEFWRRWHITLGIWFKDYVYMPLVTSPFLAKTAMKTRNKIGKRAGKSIMTIIPLMVVWILTGAWHGTGLNYIIWGLYWGFIITFSSLFSKEISAFASFLKIDTARSSWQIFCQVRTYLLFAVGRLITLDDARLVLRHMKEGMYFGSLFNGSLYTIGLNRPEFLIMLVAIAVCWGISLLQERGSVRMMIKNSNAVFRWGIYYIAIFSVIIFGVYGLGYNSSDFIYMQF